MVDGEKLITPYFNWGWNYVVTSQSGEAEIAYLFALFASSPSQSKRSVSDLDGYFDPLSLYLDNIDQEEYSYARTGVSALDQYAGVMGDLEQLKKTSVDYYAAVRSLYRQRRATEISNGADEGLPDIPNYDLNFGPETDGIADVR